MPVVRYTATRLAIFAACLGLLWWVGMRSWLAGVVALLLAWMASYVLLPRQREAAVAWVAARSEQRERAGVRSRLGAGARDDAAVEDEADEQARRAAGDGPTPTA